RVAYPLPRFGIEKRGQKRRYLRGRVELTGLFPRPGRKPADEIFVGIPDNVEVADPAGSKIEAAFAKILQQVLGNVIPLAGVPEAGLRVEVNIAEYIDELGLVGHFDFLEADVDQFPDIGCLAVLIKVGE